MFITQITETISSVVCFCQLPVSMGNLLFIVLKLQKAKEAL